MYIISKCKNHANFETLYLTLFLTLTSFKNITKMKIILKQKLRHRR